MIISILVWLTNLFWMFWTITCWSNGSNRISDFFDQELKREVVKSNSSYSTRFFFVETKWEMGTTKMKC
ncbi:MAG: hypothetical protein QXM38_03430 [Candidatus Aenigmatarchaeota archaeon]